MPLSPPDDSVKLFLSYAREDFEAVSVLYGRLKALGLQPWMDKRDLLPGQLWREIIPRKVQQSDLVLVCLSPQSVNKRGFFRSEIRAALDAWKEKLQEDIYLIPVRLAECEVPEELGEFNWVDLYDTDGWKLLLRAIEAAASELSRPVPVELVEALARKRDPLSRARAEESATTERKPPSMMQFQPLGIATGDMFYGREDQMRLVMEGLVSAALSTPFYVVGGRRSGKTSFLRELSRRLQAKDTHFAIPVYVDLNDHTPQSEEEFYRACIMCLGEAIQDEFQHESENFSPTVCVQWLNTELEVNSAQRAFENALRKIVESYSAKGMGRVVFLIDEFDRLMQLDEYSINDLFSHLRSLLLNRPIKEMLAMAFAGSSRPIQVVMELGSSFFMALQLVPLTPLEAADAKRLISEPLLDSDLAQEIALVKSDWIEWVYEATGGHPFLIQLLMKCLCDRAREDGLRQDSAFEQCKLRLSSTFEAWYTKLEVIEQQLCLIIMAKAQFGGLQAITEQDLFGEMTYRTIDAVDLRLCLQTLVTIGVVRSSTNDNGANVYSISSTAFLDWLIINQELRSRVDEAYRNILKVIERLSQLDKRKVNRSAGVKDEIPRIKKQVDTAYSRLEAVEKSYRGGNMRSIDLRLEHKRALKELDTLYYRASGLLNILEDT